MVARRTHVWRNLVALLATTYAGLLIPSDRAWPDVTAFDEQAAIARSVVSIGSFGGIGTVFTKARRGGPIVIGAIGGSVTQGAWASAERNRYVNRVAAWWSAHFPGAPVRIVNAGIGGTASNYGALRVERDLLREMPDFVIVEFSVNDEWNDASTESYEGLVRQLLRAPSHPAILLLFLATANGGSAQAQHARVGAYYNLPMVSLGDALRPMFQAGAPIVRTLYKDEIHPNDRGHAFVARLVTHWLDLALTSAAGQEGRPLTPDVFGRSQLFEGSALSPVAAAGWTYHPDRQTWEADDPGATLACDVTGSAIFLSYFSEHGPWGKVAVTIDARSPVIVDAWFEKTYGGQLRVREIARDLPAGPHRVVVRLLEDSNPESHGHAFRLFGIGASRP